MLGIKKKKIDDPTVKEPGFGNNISKLSIYLPQNSGSVKLFFLLANSER